MNQEEFNEALNKPMPSDEEITLNDLFGLLKSTLRIAKSIKPSRNMSLVITNLENAEDKLNRVIQGES